MIGPGDPIEFEPENPQRVDWEVELAAVIGASLRRASVEEALAGVFGYTVANDVSARDLQFADGQWVRGKSLDTFCPLGPVVVAPDEVGDVQALAFHARVDGQVMLHPERRRCRPTGTPWGCGES